MLNLLAIVMRADRTEDIVDMAQEDTRTDDEDMIEAMIEDMIGTTADTIVDTIVDTIEDTIGTTADTTVIVIDGGEYERFVSESL